MPKLIGIDFGSKRVGIAVSDETGSVAFPKEAIPNDVRLLSRVTALVSDEGAAAVIIGESKDARGADNPVMEDARAFADALAQESGVPVHFEPEFYTSVEARRDTERSRVDAEAAAIILNSYISRTRTP